MDDADEGDGRLMNVEVRFILSCLHGVVLVAISLPCVLLDGN